MHRRHTLASYPTPIFEMLYTKMELSICLAVQGPDMPGRCSHQRDVGLRLGHMPFIGASTTFKRWHLDLHTCTQNCVELHDTPTRYITTMFQFPTGSARPFRNVCVPGSVIWVCIESAVALH